MMDGVPLCPCGANSSSSGHQRAKHRQGDGGATPLPEPCACFSLCTATDAFDFLARLPDVSSPASPWYAYLQSVYGGGEVPLPFRLQRLQLFYKDTAEWRQRIPSPRVALPMASCVGRPRPAEWAHSTITARSRGIRRSPTQPTCAPATCRRWLVDAPGAPPGAYASASVSYTHLTLPTICSV